MNKESLPAQWDQHTLFHQAPEPHNVSVSAFIVQSARHVHCFSSVATVLWHWSGFATKLTGVQLEYVHKGMLLFWVAHCLDLITPTAPDTWALLVSPQSVNGGLIISYIFSNLLSVPSCSQGDPGDVISTNRFGEKGALGLPGLPGLPVSFKMFRLSLVFCLYNVLKIICWPLLQTHKRSNWHLN